MPSPAYLPRAPWEAGTGSPRCVDGETTTSGIDSREKAPVSRPRPRRLRCGHCCPGQIPTPWCWVLPCCCAPLHHPIGIGSDAAAGLQTCGLSSQPQYSLCRQILLTLRNHPPPRSRRAAQTQQPVLRYTTYAITQWRWQASATVAEVGRGASIEFSARTPASRPCGLPPQRRAQRWMRRIWKHHSPPALGCNHREWEIRGGRAALSVAVYGARTLASYARRDVAGMARGRHVVLGGKQRQSPIRPSACNCLSPSD
ncbi:hypothetical protein BDV95DRAFT_155546 [Massariosphaeria phaeospora]|uniref:Uncharacterized protein n=1 Tax=Massariosphaeria phaeospora TaxID=100035 RepID=A0A7C8MXY0_9PLEO|nr:hypothetical protein BDV95DRAFT_155546 [Massariosphaeria phaeospora]